VPSDRSGVGRSLDLGIVVAAHEFGSQARTAPGSPRRARRRERSGVAAERPSRPRTSGGNATCAVHGVPQDCWRRSWTSAPDRAVGLTSGHRLASCAGVGGGPLTTDRESWRSRRRRDKRAVPVAPLARCGSLLWIQYERECSATRTPTITPATTAAKAIHSIGQCHREMNGTPSYTCQGGWSSTSSGISLQPATVRARAIPESASQPYIQRSSCLPPVGVEG
jgi:hypothetical protein